MPHDRLKFTFQGGDRDKVNGEAGEIISGYTENQGEVLTRRGTSDTFKQRLGVATSRAMERRLGIPPSQEDVCKVVNTLTSRSSRFLRYAERAQTRLARLHSELQKSQGQQCPTDIAEGLIVTSIESNKRLLEEPEHNSSNPPVKRARLESGNPNPHRSPPPENAVRAPSAPMAQKHAPIAPQKTLSDAQEASCVDSQSPHARVDFPIGRPTSTDLSRPNSEREIEQRASSHSTADDASHGNRGYTESASLPAPARRKSLSAATQIPAQEIAPLPETSAATFASGVHQSPLTILGTQPQDVIGSRTDLSLNSLALPGVAVAVGLLTNTGQHAPSSPPAPVPPSVVNVPGIWAIQVGKPSTCQVDLSFEVDQDTAECVRRWATRSQGFDPYVRHVTVHLVALQANAVSAARHALSSQSSGSITPLAFALALHELQPQWPDDGTLMLQLNAGQPGEQSWFASDMSTGKPLDVSIAVLAGINSLRILQLRNMAELVFALYATLPTSEMLAAATESERQRKMYSFRRPHSGRLFR